MINNWSRSLLAVFAVLAAAACKRPADITEGRYQGMIEYEQRDLAFEVPGRVVEVKVARDQDVAPGEVLARLDDAIDRESRQVRVKEVEVAQADLALVKAGARREDIRAADAQLGAAKATEAAMRKELERERALVAKGALGAAGVDDLEARLARAVGEREALEEKGRLLRSGARAEEVARASARVAQVGEVLSLEDTRLTKRTLVAPAAGTVLERYLEPGEMAVAGAPVVSLIDRRHPYADVFVPVPEVAGLRVGAPATVVVDGDTGELRGAIERIGARAEFTPRFVFSPRERPHLVIRVRVRLDDPDGRLHAGLPAFARFERAAAPAAATAGARP